MRRGRSRVGRGFLPWPGAAVLLGAGTAMVYPTLLAAVGVYLSGGGYVIGAANMYRFDPAGIVAIGFSNGANIAASLLFRRPGVPCGAVLG